MQCNLVMLLLGMKMGRVWVLPDPNPTQSGSLGSLGRIGSYFLHYISLKIFARGGLGKIWTQFDGLSGQIWSGWFCHLAMVYEFYQIPSFSTHYFVSFPNIKIRSYEILLVIVLVQQFFL